MDSGAAWKTAEDFLRRHLKSRAVREAERRRRERRKQAAWRRTRTTLVAGGASAAGGFAVAAAAAPAVATIAAGGAALVGLVATGLWTGRARGSPFSGEELAGLPGEAEDWLLDKRLLLPRAAAGSLDRILDLLADLPRYLGAIHPDAALAWETRRLVGDHMPRLVDAWCNLPAVTREGDDEPRRRLTDGLATVADELARLARELSRDEAMRLETQSRFLESRYRDPTD